ncbi:MAG: methionine synthase, partial [Chloroflexi bacterium]|nr:methionine synthase [Chloroflexota bacterium]
VLLTTAAGSFPKPDYLTRARAQHARGAIGAPELEALGRQATRQWIAFQEAIGLDILVDGDQQCGDRVTTFAERLQGFAVGGFARANGRGPVAASAIRRPGPLTVEPWRYAQSLTRKPVKAMLTGPYTLCDWSFNEYSPDRRAAVLALAEIVRQEALDLERAGAEWIQIDEPAVSVRLDEIDLAVEAMAVVTRGLRARAIAHICYGDFAPVYPKLLNLSVDQIDLEMSHNGHSLLDLFKRQPFTKTIGFGVIDVHNHRVESKEEIKANIRRALNVLEPEQVYVDPDCGMKTRTVEEAQAKLRVMVEAAHELRHELRLN